MNQVIDYINDYLNEAEIISIDNLESKEIDKLPQWWIECLKLKGNLRKEKLLSFWQKFKDVLPVTFSYIQNDLKIIELIRHDNLYSLLYIFEVNEENYYYLGYESINLNSSLVSDRVKKNLPDYLKQFYTELHNGWVELASGALGPLPLEKCFLLSSNEWGILESIETPPLELEDMLVVLTNGGGGYLCIDLGSPDNNACIWWSDEAPDLNVDLWGAMDAWIEIALNEE